MIKKDMRIIQEFESESGKRGIYECMFNGSTKVFVRKGNLLYTIVHLYDKPELMLVRDDVAKNFIALFDN